MNMDWDIHIESGLLMLLLIADDASPAAVVHYHTRSDMADYLTWKSGKANRTVRRSIQALEASGVITITDLRGSIECQIDLSVAATKAPYEGRLPVQSVVDADLPSWFAPLADLHGYRRGNHRRAIEKIEASCTESGVEPAVVVKTFAGYYQEHRATNHWKNPVSSLCNTLKIQISKSRSVKARDIMRVNAIDWDAERARVNSRKGDV